MKLFWEVKDFAWPTSAAPISVLPSRNDPLWMALAESEVPVESEAAVPVPAADATAVIAAATVNCEKRILKRD